MAAEIDFTHVDSLVDSEQHDESRRVLMNAYENGNKESVETLWRLARTLYYMSAVDKKKHKDLMYEGESAINIWRCFFDARIYRVFRSKVCSRRSRALSR